MKVKSLIKVACNSNKVNFVNEYDKGDMILVDGCFVPLYKAKEDKRKVDSFFVEFTYNKTILNIATFYIKENTSDAIAKKKSDKKKKKKG